MREKERVSGRALQQIVTFVYLFIFFFILNE